jgi:hypothetical protein
MGLGLSLVGAILSQQARSAPPRAESALDTRSGESAT